VRRPRLTFHLLAESHFISYTRRQEAGNDPLRIERG
jgi:hypothetical protein